MARVAVDLALPHLDRPFDYLVTQEQSPLVRPGCRVRVRFAGQLVDGFVLERADASDHDGRLAYLDRVVSAEPVLAPEIAALARRVADRWAGTLSDVLRLAVPPRHRAVELAPVTTPVQTAVPAAPAAGALAAYRGGDALLMRLGAAETVRAVWPVLPGRGADDVARAVAASAVAGRGAVVVAPDARDTARLADAVQALVGAEHVTVLTADLGPAERYRRFLAVRRGQVRVVVGTRAAVWAPVADLGLLVVWDDGDDLLAEPRAPYCHARDVAILRAHRSGAALLLAGPSVSTEAAALVDSGWASLLEPTADARKRTLPAVRAAGGDAELERDPAARAARLPTLAWRAAKDALAAGLPVLVQVPRRGYQPVLSCDRCRSPARCPACTGPLARDCDDAAASCRWCGVAAAGWTCPGCGGDRLRALVVGERRTADELGRAFAGVPVRTSGGDRVLAQVPAGAAIVVATPGAEPWVPGGYGAALLLDGWALLARPDLRAGEEALRRWLVAASLVRPAADGGRLVVVAPGELRPVQALVRWQPAWLAERELAERRELHLPPVARVAALTGTPAAVAETVALADLPPVAELLGPVPMPARPGEPAQERLLVRVPRRDGGVLAERLRQAAAIRSARKAGEPVRVEVDPLLLG